MHLMVSLGMWTRFVGKWCVPASQPTIQNIHKSQRFLHFPHDVRHYLQHCNVTSYFFGNILLWHAARCKARPRAAVAAASTLLALWMHFHSSSTSATSYKYKFLVKTELLLYFSSDFLFFSRYLNGEINSKRSSK